MRVPMIAAAGLALVACEQPQAPVGATPVENETAPPAPVPAAVIDGWEVDQTAYAGINTQLPALAGKHPDGSAFTAGALRGRWTILGLWSGETPAGEANFVAALSSAADQDPDLDLLVVHAPGTTPQPVPAWPILEDNGSITAALAPPTTAAYLLVGPDLTVEGYRGPLTLTPDEGIKSVIRGVAEIRKQIAAPF